MTLSDWTEFFKWCTIINGALLFIWTVASIAASDLIFRLHSKLFPLSREAFDTMIYSSIGLFKILFFIFNLVPYLALLVVGS